MTTTCRTAKLIVTTIDGVRWSWEYNSVAAAEAAAAKVAVSPIVAHTEIA